MHKSMNLKPEPFSCTEAKIEMHFYGNIRIYVKSVIMILYTPYHELTAVYCYKHKSINAWTEVNNDNFVNNL